MRGLESFHSGDETLIFKESRGAVGRLSCLGRRCGLSRPGPAALPAGPHPPWPGLPLGRAPAAAKASAAPTLASAQFPGF